MELSLAEALAEGELTVTGRLTVASNLTLVGHVVLDGEPVQVVYKPISGEAPLWDFPDSTLGLREVAAYELSAAAGWNVVPPTVMRTDGPFGPGMCQQWIDQESASRSWVDVVPVGAAPDGWLPILEAVDGNGAPVILVHADDPALRRLAVFDVVINNADRKGGHVLNTSSDAPLVGVDHGVSFHVEPKLRTVLWGWADDELTDEERAQLTGLRKQLDDDLGRRLGELLTEEEVAATTERVDELLAHGAMPMPSGRMPVPWPVF